MALQGIDAARNNLSIASNNYASIQKQLDRYNKVFETYANLIQLHTEPQIMY